MSTKRVLSVVLAAGILILATSGAYAVPPSDMPAGVTLSYPGRLTDAAGQPVPDGAYAFIFTLYVSPAGGEPLWSETQDDVAVSAGAFSAVLGRVNAIPANLLAQGEHWLAVAVRGPGQVEFTELSPRQQLVAAPAPVAAKAGGGACPHDHQGEIWTGGGALTVRNTLSQGVGLVGVNVSSGNYGELGVYDFGVHGVAFTGIAGIYGQSPVADGVRGDTDAANKSGVYGHNTGAGMGVTGRTSTGKGVFGHATATSGLNYGVYGETASYNGYGVYGRATNAGAPSYGYGVVGETAGHHGGAGVKGIASSTAAGAYSYGVLGEAHSAYGFGGAFSNMDGGVALSASGNGVGHFKAALDVRAYSPNGVAAYMTNQSTNPTLELDQTGAGRVLDLQNGGDSSGAGGGDFIAGFSTIGSDMQFRITSSGQGRSDVGWTTPAEDFAELLAAEAGLEPGDVLVIGPEGILTRSTERYQLSVAGVYSTKPGFIGGQPVLGESENSIPLAVVGVVPVKVSAENGAIRPGDLLVTSSTAGHAMRAGSNPPLGSVIGKALEKWDAGSGTIRMLAVLQ